MYGVRPFAKGVVHAVLYNYWELQLLILIGLEMAIILTVCIFEFLYDNHKYKILFKMDILYYGSFMVLDFLLLCKHLYFKGDEKAVVLLEEILTNLIYFMIILTILKFLWQYIPWEYLKKKCKENDEE